MEMENHQAADGGSDEKICRRHNGKFWRCKKLSGDNQLEYCEKHYKDFLDFYTENPSLLVSSDKIRFLTKEKKEELEEMQKKNKQLPDEQFCCQHSESWRCKNLRMGHGAAADDPRVPKTKYCEKHYNYYAGIKNRKKLLKKQTSGDGAGCSTATGPVEEAKGSKQGEKVSEEDDEAEIQKLGAAGDNTSDTIARKRENAERTERSGELESLAGIGETVVELERLEHYRSKCFELSVELEKKKVECTTLQSKLEEVEESRKTSAADGTECWRKLFSDMAGCVQSRISDLESIVLRMENKISTLVGCVESLLRNGKENSILRCVELRDFEKIESEAQGSQNAVTRSGEKQIDETSSGGKKDSHVYQWKENALNVYDVGSLHLSSVGGNVKEGKGCGCSDARPYPHGSSSPDHLEMSTHPFVYLVSDDDSVEILGDSEDSDISTDSEGSLGTLMDMLAMKYRNTNEDKETKWKFEADMLSSFAEDPELCLKAVCALYRQHICEDEISDKGLFHNSDALSFNWCTTLAKFLMDGDCEGDLNKSVKELEIQDAKGVEDCKRLARRYSTQLFSIYEDGKDPFFLPATTAIHGDETAK